MKKTALFLSTALLSYTVFASPVDVETARDLGAKFLSSKMELAHAPLSLLHTGVDKDGDHTFYVFQPADQRGFVLVAADDLVYPVLGYSTDRSWGTDMPSHIQYWLDGYSRQIDYIVEAGGDPDPEVASQWKMLGSTGTLTTGEARPTVVTPFLTTTWNQAPYYNDYSPPNTPIGCVATAMAQIMFYWGHPVTGSGSYSYTHRGNTLSADFGATTYQWDDMPVELNDSSSAEEVDAVATLMYHCAIAVRMNFDRQGSGAQVISPRQNYPASDLAFVNYFGYKPTLKSYYRDDFSSDQWINMLKFELDNGRPVLYAGFGDLGGHAFDFDGYDANDFFHVNWGWGGMSDGYFIVSNLSPSALGIGGGGGNFNTGQQVLAMIEPANSTLPENPFGPDYHVQLKMASSLTVSLTAIPYNTGFSIQGLVKNLGPDTFRNGMIVPIFMDTASGSGFSLPGTLYDIVPEEEVDFTFTTNGEPDLLPGVYAVGLGYLKDTTNPDVNFIAGEHSNYPVFQLLEVLEDPNAIGDNAEGALSLLIYPNPADAYVTIQLHAASSPIAQISVTNLAGQEVKALRDLNTRSYRLPVEDLSAGMYHVSIQLEDQQVITRKVVVH